MWTPIANLTPRSWERTDPLAKVLFPRHASSTIYPIIGLFLRWDPVGPKCPIRRIFSDLDLWYDWALCVLQDSVIPSYLI
jgi:hypothetical protein